MAIGSPPPQCSAAMRVPALRRDRTFTAGKLGHLNGPALGRRSAWIFFEAFITPPQPFAEAERKASPNNASIIRFRLK
jgi:hypothetical protein